MRHWLAVLRVLRYLSDTQEYCFLYLYKGETRAEKVSIDAFSYADYANDPESRKSIDGILIKVAGCAVIFRSQRQKLLAHSTCEAEFVAANEATKDVIWLTKLLEELEVAHQTPVLHIDNLPSLKTIRNGNLNIGLKHIDITVEIIGSIMMHNLYSRANVRPRIPRAVYLNT